MGKISILPETVQNKIAAGEVIERPASVVKELAENAMDAGATLVDIEIQDGGHRLIRVSDNGCGMDEADLVASMQRHATSKISDVDDIFRIATFGFRGEALPSIGSVSRMRIATGTGADQEGRELMVEGGQMVRLTPAQPRQGTRVEIRDIFFNTPARRKFLRHPASEGTRSAEIVTRLGLGNPGIGFRLQINERIALSVRPVADQTGRIAELFGKQVADRLAPFHGEVADGLSVSGFFARPPHSCKTTRDIYILVNRRWIRHYGLAKAISEAFGGILPPREHPFVILNIQVDPARVDVNVHPTKEEVRFEQERLLISGVRRSIRQALEGLAAVPTAATFTVPPEAPDRRTSPHESGTGKGTAPDGRTTPAETGQNRLRLPSSFARPANRDFSTCDFNVIRSVVRGSDRQFPPADKQAAPGSEPASEPSASPSETRETETVTGQEREQNGLAVGSVSQHRIIGQTGGKYILIDSPDGLLLVDPHALHERWNFDRLRARRGTVNIGKKLLLPLVLHLSAAEAATAAAAADALTEFGFEVNLDDRNQLTVTAAPDFLPPGKMETLLRQILEDVGDGDVTIDKARDSLLASMACRSSVLLGRTLPEEEMLSLLDKFFDLGQLPTCPHGRPTAIRIGWEELGRRFGR